MKFLNPRHVARIVKFLMCALIWESAVVTSMSYYAHWTSALIGVTVFSVGYSLSNHCSRHGRQSIFSAKQYKHIFSPHPQTPTSAAFDSLG